MGVLQLPQPRHEGRQPTHTFIAIPMDQQTAAGDGASAGEWDTPPDLLTNQSVSVIEGEQVTQPKSHDDA